MNPQQVLRVALLAVTLTSAATAFAQRAPVNPLLPENATTQVSAHVHVIVGWPNVGIIVGERATLVVDTGLGPRNGAIVAKQAARLSRGGTLYLTTTHFHAEHSAGEGGFPPGTVLIRPRVQQEELEQGGAAFVERFRQNPANAELLAGEIRFRKPEVIFENEYRLDLGGVHVRLIWVGPAHTGGDQVVLVEEDRTLLSGDLAMKNNPPRNFAAGADAKTWVATLERLAALQPLHVIPDHGEYGDASLISEQRATMSKP